MSSNPPKVDRAATTPFLLKVFYRTNTFHRLDDFRATSQPTSLVEVYTWKDCSLSELTTLLLSALPSFANSATKCSFRLIYADTKTNRYTSQMLGDIPLPLSSDMTGTTLAEASFVVGDWIDVAVTTNSQRGSISAQNGIRIRGGGRASPSSVPHGEWRKGERLDDDGPPPISRKDSSGPGRGGGRFGGGRRGRW